MPDPATREAERKAAQIARINEISGLARTAWFTLLAYLVFVGITLLGVEDADFFVPSRRTHLPLANVEIPTASFFWTAPILGAALYTYLHLFLIKLWDAHVPPTRDDDATHHWLVNDFVLIRQRDPVARARPLAWLTVLITRLLVWAAGPLVLAYAWWRSMPAHDEWLTLLIAACLGVTLYVGFTSWGRAESRLRPWRTPWWRGWHKWTATVVGAVVLVVVSWLRTEGGVDHHANRLIDLADAVSGTSLFKDCAVYDEAGNAVSGRIRDDCLFANGDPRDLADVQRERVAARLWSLDTFTLTHENRLAGIWLGWNETWNPLARTDLEGVELVELPEAWREPETARATFRKAWCEREGLPAEVCDHPVSADRPEPPTRQSARETWCDGHEGADRKACLDHLARLDSRFETAWTEERRAARANLPRLELAGRDLRNASAAQASFVNADLVGARLEGANLVRARLEGAILGVARLEGADLYQARLDGADLRGARLEGANLGGARLEGANLGGARLEGANLRGARLEGANLGGARLEGANLRDGDFRRSNWAGASNRASPAQFADLRGAQALTQAQLDELIGNAGTLLPEGDAPETGEPYRIASCWETPPPDLDRIVATAAAPYAGDAGGALRAEFLCGPSNPRRIFETGLALDAPYPPGHPLADPR